MAGSIGGTFVLLGWLVWAWSHDLSLKPVLIRHGFDPLALSLLILGFRVAWNIEYEKRDYLRMLVLDTAWFVGAFSFAVGIGALFLEGAIAMVIPPVAIVGLLGIGFLVLAVLGLLAHFLMFVVRVPKYIRRAAHR